MKRLLFLVLMITNLFGANPIAVLETTQGIIELELRPDIAPKTVENFTTHINFSFEYFRNSSKNFDFAANTRCLEN